LSESEALGAGLTAAERAEIAAQSLRSAELEGGSVTPETRTAQESLERAVRDRRGVHPEGDPVPVFASVDAAARAYAAGVLSDGEFIAAVVGLQSRNKLPCRALPSKTTCRT